MPGYGLTISGLGNYIALLRLKEAVSVGRAPTELSRIDKYGDLREE
jgi:hypothetical protein